MRSGHGGLGIKKHLNQITNKPRIRYLDISNRDLNGNADLKDFTSLKSLNLNY